MADAIKEGERQVRPAVLFIRKFLNDWSMDLSAMLAYNLIIALVPMGVAVFGILGFVLQNYPETQVQIIAKIITSFQFDNTTQVGVRQVLNLTFKQLSKDAGFILFIGIIFALFGASRLFITIDKCMTIIYRLPERTFIKQNILAFGMLFTFIILIPIMIAASSAPAALMGIIPGGFGRFGAFLAGMLASFAAAFILFESIYWLVPHKTMSFKGTWCGALVAAIGLEIFILLFPFYVSQFMGNYSGLVGFAVILILFFFYFATILILGAQINAFFFEHYKPFAHGLGTCLSQMYEKHEDDADDPRRPLLADEDDIQQ